MKSVTEKKPKMSNKKFRAILIPLLSLLVVAALAVTIAMNYFSVTMDGLLGRGERHVLVMEGTENWDTEYYEEFSAEQAKENSYEVSARIQDEGTVLLKNNGVLPLKKNSAVTPFGYAYTGAEKGIFGQIGEFGSAKWTVDPVKLGAGLSGYLTVNADVESRLRGEPERLKGAAGTDSGEGDVWGNSIISEYPPSVYDGTEGSMSGTVGLVFISRTGSEGQDKKRDAYTDGTRHYLALFENEKAAIGISKQNCDKTVVIFVSSAPMELSPLMEGELEADAVLWYGHPGERGFSELGKILTGEINPSGRTVDIFASDFTADPSFACFGDFYYSNVSFAHDPLGGPGRNGVNYRSFVEYREDMYMGYRYYETAAEEDENFVYGTLDGRGGVSEAGAVAYPFGYGLSYTSFRQSIQKFDDAGDTVKVTVTVENTGMVAGKDVVQVYYSAPYTAFDEQNRIESSAVTLAAFTKTEEIPAGESRTVTLEFYKEDMASYCYTRANPDGTEGCYVLEEGDYEISLRSDSHTVIESRQTEIPQTVWYDNENPRRSEREAQSALDDEGNVLPWHQKGTQAEFTAATNLFRDSSMYMLKESQILTRRDWDGTFPAFVSQAKTLHNTDLTAYLQYPQTFDPATDGYLGNLSGSRVYAETAPASGEENGLTLSDMRGKSYYDETWEELLDQIDWQANADGILKLLCRAGYAMGEVPDVGLPDTKMVDGVTSLKTGGLPYAIVIASTWDVELAEKVGYIMGELCLWSKIDAGDAAPNLTGWYAPAMNIHRTPFGGRNFEYYSECGVLSGIIGSKITKGATDRGVVCYIKHFALNEQDRNRMTDNVTWAREQAIREIYLKPFEMSVKEGGTLGLMTSYNRIGTTWAGGNYALISGVLRGEWGFNGFVLTDYMDGLWENVDQMLAAGGDAALNSVDNSLTRCTSDGAQARTYLRRATHHALYAFANSNAMNGYDGATIVHSGTPRFHKIMIGVNVGLGILIAGCLAVIPLKLFIFGSKAGKQKGDKKHDA